jgi:hypothetical protein
MPARALRARDTQLCRGCAAPRPRGRQGAGGSGGAAVGAAGQLRLLAVAALVAQQRSLAYLQPTGPSLGTADRDVWPRTHGDITNAAIRLLEADGHSRVASIFSAPEAKAALFDGLRQADMGGGEFILSMYGSAGRAPRNSFSHFYNPLTKEGFVFPIPSTNGLVLNPDPHLMMRTRWEVSLMLGPMPSAIDMIDWEYARAVAAMAAGEQARAFTFLGRALHIMQDVTVPHHATDKPSGLPGTKHTEYEAMCEILLRNASQVTPAPPRPAPAGTHAAARLSAQGVGAAQLWLRRDAAGSGVAGGGW